MEWIMMKSLLQILKWHLFIAYYYGFIRRWQLSQINVKNVFLNSDHKEEVYMQHLSRLYSDHENQVADCIMLNMSLRRHHMLLWFFFFFFFFFFFMQSPYASVFYVQCSNQRILLLLLYMHDMVVMRNNIDGIETSMASTQVLWDKRS